MKYAFQDDENCFFVLDLMLGGDLRYHLVKNGKMSEALVKVYAVELSLGLNDLHEKHIVHRDLKPDNILLDKRGHAHLTDFNVATKFKEGKPMHGIVGSLAYMGILMHDS